MRKSPAGDARSLRQANCLDGPTLRLESPRGDAEDGFQHLLSSTFADLERHRAKVREVIQRLG
jgi:hypothetical protein